MNKSFFILFFFLCHSATAQISGTVIDEKGQPIEFATVYNLINKMSTITNVEGKFHIPGLQGDSIRIQHLNYKMLEVKVFEEKKEYILIEKVNNLSEVPVTAGFVMIKKSCENTYKKFKDKNVLRGYLRYYSTNDNDTTQIIDVDLDIVQRKRKDFDKGESISPFKVQERNKNLAFTTFVHISPLFLNINFINDWASSLGHVVYEKLEDDFFLKYYFFGQDSVDISKIVSMEIVIQKSDTCLLTINYRDTFPFMNREGVGLEIKSHCWYLKYEYINGFAYLSELMSRLIIPNPRNIDKLLEASLFYKTYNNGVDNLKRRPNGHAIFHNLWVPGLIKNRYQVEFWNRTNSKWFNENTFNYVHKLKEETKHKIWFRISGPFPNGFKYGFLKDQF